MLHACSRDDSALFFLFLASSCGFLLLPLCVVIVYKRSSEQSSCSSDLSKRCSEFEDWFPFISSIPVLYYPQLLMFKSCILFLAMFLSRYNSDLRIFLYVFERLSLVNQSISLYRDESIELESQVYSHFLLIWARVCILPYHHPISLIIEDRGNLISHPR